VKGLIEEPCCDDFLEVEFQKEQEFVKRQRSNFRTLNYKVNKKKTLAAPVLMHFIHTQRQPFIPVTI